MTSKSNYGSAIQWDELRERAKRAAEEGRVSFVPLFGEATKRTEEELPDFTEQVSRGAAWLDRVDPGWDVRLDVGHLDLNDQNMCVLGQTWNHYGAMRVLQDDLSNFHNFLVHALATDDCDAIYAHAHEHGFALNPDVYAWINVTGERRFKEAPGSTTHLCEPLDGKPCDFKHQFDHIVEVEAAVWEHLTLTWITLVQARQQVAASRRRYSFLSV